MKKSKRVLALVGVIILCAMYGSTLIFAFIDNSKTMGLLKASIACTIILPVLLYAYTLVYKLIRGDNYASSDNDSDIPDNISTSGTLNSDLPNSSTTNHED